MARSVSLFSGQRGLFVRSGSVVLAGAVATIGLISCYSIFGHACTLMACLDGVSVVIIGSASTEYSVELSDSEGGSKSDTCTTRPDGSCRRQFSNYHPEEVTVRVSGPDQEVSVTVRPDYQKSQPNGPDCTPTCYLATVALDLGAAG